jgi:hypothetical protein
MAFWRRLNTDSAEVDDATVPLTQQRPPFPRWPLPSRRKENRGFAPRLRYPLRSSRAAKEWPTAATGGAMVDNRGILVDDAPFLAAELRILMSRLLRQAAVQRRYGRAAKGALDFSVRNANECELDDRF